MSSEFITLTRDDPEFESYLLGTFSTTERALPVETYHAQSYRERVTFRIVPRAEVGAPAWWMVYFLACRPDLLGLTLGPAVAAWLNHHASLSEWNRWPSWLALVGVFFLHTAAFLFNDVQDHIYGSDRLNRRRGSQVIQKGWSSAAEMRRWALVNFILSVIFGAPAILRAPLELALVCMTAGACLWILLRRFGTRFGLCDLALVLLFGPLLTLGTSLASFGETSWADAALGLALGLSAAWVFQVRQLENLFRSKPESFHTLLGRFNFDRVRWILIVEGFLLLSIQPAVSGVLRVPLVALAVLPIASFPSIWLMNRIYKSTSPLASTLVDCSKLARTSHFAWAGWWIVALGLTWL